MKSMHYSLPEDWKAFLTRQNIERLTLLFILICLISVFIGRIPSQRTLTLDDGKIKYSGTVLANKIDGKGKLTFENGDTYEGQFKNGSFNGQGTFTSKDGWSYSGRFVNGLADGKGKLTTKAKSVYEGTFKQGIYQHED
ncbi:hypothetical protein Q7W37_06480 [Streptococcus suis]|nr:hypothetical protein [Streptococcus suis]